MCQQEYEEAPAVWRRTKETDTPAEKKFCSHEDFFPGPAGGSEGAGEDPEDRPEGQVRGGADQDDVVPRLPGTASHQTLHLLLSERDEGLPGSPRRAGGQLGQISRQPHRCGREAHWTIQY